MSGDEKLIGILIGCVTVAVLMVIGWGCLISINAHNFDVVCMQSGKTIQYHTLQGQQEPVKECK